MYKKIADSLAWKISNVEEVANYVVIGKENVIDYLNVDFLKHIDSDRDNLFIKVRSTGKLTRAKINLQKNGAEVNLEEVETGISPGQACVLYLGDQLLGGGWIAK